VAESDQSSLAGKRIVLTRAAAQSEALAKELEARGAKPLVVPLVAFAAPENFAPLDEAIANVQQFDWLLFTSAQAVRAISKRNEELRLSFANAGGKLRVACVGPVSAAAARNVGLAVHYIAEMHSGKALAEELGESVRDAKVLLPRSDRANPDLPAALQRHGAKVTEVIAYRTLKPAAQDEQSLRQVAAGAADAILFFSPSAVHHFAELFGAEQLRALQAKLAITAVGPVTANALHEVGVEQFTQAKDTTSSAVIEALEEHFSATTNGLQAGAKRA
jgi:uroporphyrinogen III methyltransferase / synthase